MTDSLDSLSPPRREAAVYEMSRGLAFIGFTRQVLEKKNAAADPHAQRLYYALEPPAGIHGVNRDLLVDIDETGVWMACCRRTRGHAPRGESATTNAPYNVGKKYTAILAIDTGGSSATRSRTSKELQARYSWRF